jgi:hypothetical protein
LLGERHWWLSRRQLRLARFGPDLEVFPGGGEEIEALHECWKEWERRFGLAWRVQNECPNFGDEDALARREGVGQLEYGRLVAIVEEHLAAFDRSLPDPPGWELLEPASPAAGEQGLSRVRCGACGARVIVFAAEVADAVPASSLPRLGAALAGVRDREGFSYALADRRGHFVCPGCGEDEYRGGPAAA